VVSVIRLLRTLVFGVKTHMSFKLTLKPVPFISKADSVPIFLVVKIASVIEISGSLSSEKGILIYPGSIVSRPLSYPKLFWQSTCLEFTSLPSDSYELN